MTPVGTPAAIKALLAREVVNGEETLRQAGIVAAACTYALDHNIARLAEDHDNAKALARGLAQLEGITVEDPDVFAAPWRYVRAYHYRPDLRLQEYSCLDNNRNLDAQGLPTFPK